MFRISIFPNKMFWAIIYYGRFFSSHSWVIHVQPTRVGSLGNGQKGTKRTIIITILFCQQKFNVFKNFNILPFLYFSLVRVLRFITNMKYALCIFMLACHMTIITLIHWIKIDNVLFLMIIIDSQGTDVRPL